MSSSIDRAFIRAFAKQQGAGQQDAGQQDAGQQGAGQQDAGQQGAGQPELAEPIAADPELVVTQAPSVISDHGPVDSVLAAAQAAVEQPAPVRRVDQPQATPSPLWQQSLVGAEATAVMNFSTLDVSDSSSSDRRSSVLVDEPFGDIKIDSPRPVARALTPEQVMRRLDDPGQVSSPHSPQSGEQADSRATADDATDDSKDGATDDSKDDATDGAGKQAQDAGAGDAVAEVRQDDAHADARQIAPGPTPLPEVKEKPAQEPQPQPGSEYNAADDELSQEPPRPISIQGAAPFVPAWETDRIQWPRMSERLATIDHRFRDAGRQLAAATADGLKVLAVTSTYRGEGRSTIAMNMARAASQAGVRVALVDGDVDNPVLASAAGIAAAHGWHECVEGGLPLDEAAVASVEDGVTLLPLTSAVRRAAVEASGPAFRSMLDALSMHYDLVIVDYGPLGAGPDGPQTLTGDAALLVRDIRCTSAEQALSTVRRIRELGPKSVGVVQNFTQQRRHGESTSSGPRPNETDGWSD